MKQFREDNTEGYSADELGLLNDVFARLQNWFPGVEAKNITDAIGDSFESGISEDALYSRVARTLAA